MSKAVAIVAGYWDSAQLQEAIRTIQLDTDVLAFDLPAMQICRVSGIRFITPQDLYSSAEFRQTFGQVLITLEDLFESIDQKYEIEIGYPHAFSANFYPFAVYLADLHYLSGLGKAIREQYTNKYILIAGSEDIESNSARIPMSCDIFENQMPRKDDAAIYNLRRLSGLLGSPPLVVRGRRLDKDYAETSSLRQFQRRYGYLLKPSNWSLLLRKIGIRLSRSKDIDDGQKLIWYIQGGYEVAALEKYMPNLTFVNPVDNLRRKPSSSPSNLISPIYKEAVCALGDLYPEWATELEELMRQYHEKIVSREPVLAEKIAEQIDSDRPQCALYSIGAIRPLEDLYAWVLNQQNVPIYSFQHGGGSLYFCFNPMPKIEFKTCIDQTTFCVSKVEAELQQKHVQSSQSSVVAGGSIRLFEWHTARTNASRESTNGRILYIQGHYPSDAWKTLFTSEGEEIIFAKHEQFFSLASKYDLKVDIKLFPARPGRFYLYFRSFLKRYGIRVGRLLFGERAELLAPNYDLVIIEYIGSALNSFFMVLDRPVVYYLAEQQLINPAIEADFCRRHYIAHNGKELDELLQRYKQGTLLSKYSLEFVDKYAYPLENGNPGVRVAKILRQA